MAGAGGTAGTFPAGPRVRHHRPTGDGSRVSASTRIAAAVVAVGGIAGAAHATVGSGEIPSPAAWFDAGTTAATADAAAAVPAPRAPADNAPADTAPAHTAPAHTAPADTAPADTAQAAPIADSATIAALATPAAAGGSAAARTVTAAGPGVHTGAAEAVEGAAASVTKVQEAAAEQARAAEAARAAGATGTLQSASAGGVSIVSGRVTSGFGSRWGSQHKGLDVAAPIGTPIHVPQAGTVISSGSASGFGMWVRVKHDDGTITVYGHINRSLVETGQQVSAGQQIAEVGNRGQSTGPHLHIEVIDPSGTKINPKPWLDANGFSYT